MSLAGFYIIGDVHGMACALRGLLRLIFADKKKADEDMPREARVPLSIICLGDMIDRGPDSREVIEIFLTGIPIEVDVLCLRGNHEDLALRFLGRGDEESGRAWLSNGGIATLRSYEVPHELPWQQLRDCLSEAMPASHRAFLESLPLYYQQAHYVFVHAGLRPGIPLAEQDPHDLLWIRNPFLHQARDDGLVVIHGHTPSSQPQVLPWRIGIDTGAFATGKLTCVVLGQKKGYRFLTTTDDHRA